MHYNTWPHSCCLPQGDKVPEQWCSCGAGSSWGCWGGGTPGRVSCRVSTAHLSHSTHSPLEPSARVNPAPDVAFLSATVQISPTCFPSLLLRLLRHTALCFTASQVCYLQVKTCHDPLIPVQEDGMSTQFPVVPFPQHPWTSKMPLPPHAGSLLSSKKITLFHLSWYRHCHRTLVIHNSLFRFFSVLPNTSGTRGQEWYRVLRVQLDQSYRNVVLFSCLLSIPFLISP